MKLLMLLNTVYLDSFHYTYFKRNIVSLDRNSNYYILWLSESACTESKRFRIQVSVDNHFSVAIVIRYAEANVVPWKNVKSRINRSQIKCLHSLNIIILRDKIRGEDIQNKLNIQEIIHEIENSQTKWSQHVTRILVSS